MINTKAGAGQWFDRAVGSGKRSLRNPFLFSCMASGFFKGGERMLGMGLMPYPCEPCSSVAGLNPRLEIGRPESDLRVPADPGGREGVFRAGGGSGRRKSAENVLKMPFFNSAGQFFAAKGA